MSLKVGKVGIILFAAAVLLLASGILYLYYSELSSESKPGKIPAQTKNLSPDKTDENSHDLAIPLLEFKSPGYNKSALPPVYMYVSNPPDNNDAPDLTSPANAVHSFLSHVDKAATESLGAFFVEEKQTSVNNLYPDFVGPPIELVEVIHQDSYAEVIWNAQVHTAFTYYERNLAQGETMKLKTRLVRQEDTWKILELHTGAHDVRKKEHSKSD